MGDLCDLKDATYLTLSGHTERAWDWYEAGWSQFYC